MHASIYLLNLRKSFFSVRYLEYDFMIAMVIKFSCCKYVEDVPGTNQWLSAMLGKLQAFIPQSN